ncbi:MAG: thioether cross-link-forming SCIFF peptide maturase [Oscillospiraceae bacterium]|nr:thioether cross-link-forming SCIFF peptide maturase [Oscillospiraceae bacterium]
MIHCFKLGGINIVLDVNSGSVHKVDDVAYDAISMFEISSKEEIVCSLKSKYEGLTDEDANELFSEIEGLKQCNKLFSPDKVASVAAGRQVGSLKAMCMNVAHVCNMECSYCFAGRGAYGAGEGLMSLEVGKRAIDFLVEHSDGRKNLDVDFFGGEPLLNFEVVKDIVKYARTIEQGSGKKFRFTLTTNGLLIDEDVIDFAHREIHNVVLSLDGRPETNDMHRKSPEGMGSYDLILPKLQKMVSERRGKGYYIRGTITSKNLDFVNDILHVADLGFAEISFEPVVAKDEEPYSLRMDDLPKLSGQYEALAVEMLKRRKEGRGFSFYHFNIDLTGGPCVHKRIAGCGVAAEYVAVTPSGSLYPCHQFVGDEQFELGDIWRGITNGALRDEIGKWNIYSREECAGCWAKMYCAGGCAANAYNDCGFVGGVYALGCEIFKKRLECAIMMKVAEA